MRNKERMSKPRSEVIHPEITRLPVLSSWRLLFRRLVQGLIRLLVWIFCRVEVIGIENMPKQGPLIIVSNHLGDADVIVGLTITRLPIDIMVKSELYDTPIFGKAIDAYGVIWVHRGQPDRKALRVALDSLRAGRSLALAPEGRESLTGSLEEGTGGAAYIAQKAKVPIMPVTFTGTENWRVFGNLRRLKRSYVTVTIGPVFYLGEYQSRHQAIEQGTAQIMRTLARQLPPEYRGVYREAPSPQAVQDQKILEQNQDSGE